MSTQNRGRGRPSTGTLERRSSGYAARIMVTIDGERVRKTFDLGTRDKAVARRKMARLVKAAKAGTVNVALAAGEPQPETYAQAADRIRTLREQEGVRDVANERIRDRLHINPLLGGMPVNEVTPAHVKSVLEDAQASGKARGTLIHIRKNMNIVFDALWREGAIAENTVKRVPRIKGKEDRRERVVLTDEELAAYLAWEHPNKLHRVAVIERQTMSVLSRGFGGLRTGDLHALRWEALDVPTFGFGWAPRRKTARPEKLPIADVLRPFLRRWWEMQGEPTEGLVFPTLRGKEAGEAAKTGVGHAKALRRDLKRAFGLEVYDSETGSWEAAKGADGEPRIMTLRERELFEPTEHTKPVDFHSWRRAFNQALADAGASAQQAMALAGHGSLDAHARYLQNTARMKPMPEAALPKLVFLPGRRQKSDSDVAHNCPESLAGGIGFEPTTFGSGERDSEGNAAQSSASDAKNEAENRAARSRGQNAGKNPTPLPAGPLSALDLVEAADRAVLAGDAHGARRALSELRDRLTQAQRTRRGGSDV